MATNNAINSPNPIGVSSGGTGAGTFTANGILYGNGTSAVGVTAVGTAAQVLTSNGAGVAPTYQAAPSGNTMFLIQTQTASSSATINFTTGITATYDSYFFVFSAIVPATNGAILQMKISTNGGSSYVASGYFSGINYSSYNSATLTNASSTSLILLSDAIANTASLGASGSGYMENVTSGKNFCAWGFTVFNGSSAGSGASCTFMTNTGTNTVNAIQFLMSSGNISAGTFSIYGILR